MGHIIHLIFHFIIWFIPENYLGYLGFLVVLIGLLQNIFSSRYRKNKFRKFFKEKQLKDNIVDYEISEDYLNTKSNIQSNHFSWSDFLEKKELKDFFAFITRENIAFIIPKKLLNPNEIEWLKNRLSYN